MTELDALFESIRVRVAELPARGGDREAILAHLRSLARWGQEPLDYPEPGEITFPAALSVAYAVCHPDCGAREFIVDGSTQACQHCGGHLFRTEVRDYVLRPAAT